MLPSPFLFRFPQARKEGLAGRGEVFFQFARAIAIAAGPKLRAILVPAVLSIVSVLNFYEVKIFLPIREFFVEGCGTEAGFDPLNGPVGCESGLGHIVEVFVSGDGPAPQAAIGDGLDQLLFTPVFQARFNQILHTSNLHGPTK
jgi:hypothetical protein